MLEHPPDAATRPLTVSGYQRPRSGQTVQAYTRTLVQHEVTFTCVECGRTRTQLQYPGGRPRQYCNILCAEAGRRRRAADRKHRQRLREKVAHHAAAAGGNAAVRSPSISSDAGTPLPDASFCAGE
jgi:hypothetical protein